MALALFLIATVMVWLSGAIILAFWVIPRLMCYRMHRQIMHTLKEEARR